MYYTMQDTAISYCGRSTTLYVHRCAASSTEVARPEVLGPGQDTYPPMNSVDPYLLAHISEIRGDILSLASSQVVSGALAQQADSLESHVAEVHHRNLTPESRKFIFQNIGFLHIPLVFERFSVIVRHSDHHLLALYLRTLIALCFFVRSIQHIYVADIFEDLLNTQVFIHAEVCSQSFESALFFAFLHRMWQTDSDRGSQAMTRHRDSIYTYIDQAAAGSITPCCTLLNIIFWMLRDFAKPDIAAFSQAIRILHRMKTPNSMQNMRVKEILTYIAKEIESGRRDGISIFIANDGLNALVDFITISVHDTIVNILIACSNHLKLLERANIYQQKAFEQLSELHLRTLSYCCSQYLLDDELQSVYLADMEKVYIESRESLTAKEMVEAMRTVNFLPRFITEVLSPLLAGFSTYSIESKKVLFSSSLRHFYFILSCDLKSFVDAKVAVEGLFRIVMTILRRSTDPGSIVSLVKCIDAGIVPLLFQAIDYFAEDSRFLPYLEEVFALLAAFLSHTSSVSTCRSFNFGIILKQLAFWMKRCDVFFSCFV